MNKLTMIGTIALAFAGLPAHACENSVPLDGSIVMVENCSVGKPGCKAGADALYAYMDLADDDDARLTIGLQTSPWRMYDGDMRILRMPEVVQVVRSNLHGTVKKVELQGSWTGTAPGPGSKSLASQLSTALGGFPVSGMDGFLWISSKGKVRTTRQSFTVRKGSGFYGVRDGGEVMVALTVGWAAEAQSTFEKQKDALGMLHAGVGWDAYFLCPDGALRAFERASEMGNAIGAYNAAVMHLDRAHKGDREAAIKLLSRAAQLHDAKSAALLKTLR